METELHTASEILKQGLETLKARIKVLVFQRERLRWSDKLLLKRADELAHMLIVF